MKRAVLTSDQGVVYHLKHGLSKQVFSSSGFSLGTHASSSKIWNFPPVMPTHRTFLRFTPRPHVVLHCGRAFGSHCKVVFCVSFLQFARNCYLLKFKLTKIVICCHSLCSFLAACRVLPSPTPDSANGGHSPSHHRGGWPVACSPRNIGSQEPRDPQAPCSTRDAPSCPGRTTPSTATVRVKGQIG